MNELVRSQTSTLALFTREKLASLSTLVGDDCCEAVGGHCHATNDKFQDEVLFRRKSVRSFASDEVYQG